MSSSPSTTTATQTPPAPSPETSWAQSSGSMPSRSSGSPPWNCTTSSPRSPMISAISLCGALTPMAAMPSPIECGRSIRDSEPSRAAASQGGARPGLSLVTACLRRRPRAPGAPRPRPHRGGRPPQCGRPTSANQRIPIRPPRCRSGIAAVRSAWLPGRQASRAAQSRRAVRYPASGATHPEPVRGRRQARGPPY